MARILRKGASAPPAPSPRQVQKQNLPNEGGGRSAVSANDLNPFQIERKDHYNGPEAEKSRGDMPKAPVREWLRG